MHHSMELAIASKIISVLLPAWLYIEEMTWPMQTPVE
jgi:hypothetical protein